jgi:hypothetical protein
MKFLESLEEIEEMTLITSAAQTAQPVKREFYIEANGQQVSDAQYKRILNSKGQDTSSRVARSSLSSNKGFSLM